ncbi:MAG: glycosyltransferase family 39 protein [Bryobacteraceae bacterium]
MIFRIVAAVLLAVAAYLLYFHDISSVGLLSVDEPRYAAVGRAMAQSGDWITPRLWGEVWLEKPPLLYWTVALATSCGLRDESAARFPIALLAALFLVFYWWSLRRYSTPTAASYSTAILATSLGWVAYTGVAVTDLPVAVFFAAAMLAAIPVALGHPASSWRLAAGGVLLGLAVLTKAFLPVVFAIPLVWFARRRPSQLVIPALAAVAVAAPWYLAAYLRHGRELIDILFLRHQFDRFFRAGAEVLHPAPWWFYVPVVLAGLLPWTPLLPLATLRTIRRDPLIHYFGAIFGFGFVFLSLSSGKLPGYILPVFPFLTAIIGIAADRTRVQSWMLAAPVAIACTLSFLVPFAPAAIEYGITRATLPPPLTALAVFAGSTLLATIVFPRIAVRWRGPTLLFLVLALVIQQKHRLATVLEASISARPEWARIHRLTGSQPLCENWLRRQWLYGFNYYRGSAIERCPDPPPENRLRLESDPETGRPVVVSGPVKPAE